jgi:hypothetical protein
MISGDLLKSAIEEFLPDLCAPNELAKHIIKRVDESYLRGKISLAIDDVLLPPLTGYVSVPEDKNRTDLAIREVNFKRPISVIEFKNTHAFFLVKNGTSSNTIFRFSNGTGIDKDLDKLEASQKEYNIPIHHITAIIRSKKMIDPKYCTVLKEANNFNKVLKEYNYKEEDVWNDCMSRVEERLKMSRYANYTHTFAHFDCGSAYGTNIVISFLILSKV